MRASWEGELGRRVGKRGDIPLRLNISCEYLPESANAFGISPNNSMT